jgi:hypothetical protein
MSNQFDVDHGYGWGPAIFEVKDHTFPEGSVEDDIITIGQTDPIPMGAFVIVSLHLEFEEALGVNSRASFESYDPDSENYDFGEARMVVEAGFSQQSATDSGTMADKLGYDNPADPQVTAKPLKIDLGAFGASGAPSDEDIVVRIARAVILVVG